MSAIELYLMNSEKTNGLWASVILKDTMVYEGIVISEQPFGIYLLVGGDSNRFNLFTWTTIARVVYRDPAE